MNFFGIDITEEDREKLELFKVLLQQHNKLYNLTAICDDNGIYIKHFCDSILPQRLFPQGASVCEVGSGAGFPSIPLKIARKDLSFTLIESTGKKCAFLNTVIDNLQLNGVKVLNIRAEDGGRMAELRESFDVCTARAVAALNTLCEYCLPFVKVGGRLIAYKGDCVEELEKSEGAIKILGGETERIEYYELPEGGGKRTVVVIKKVSATPLKYPRGRGLERKKPL